MRSRGVFASNLRSTNCGGLCHQPLTECTSEQKKSLAVKGVSETVLLVVNKPDIDACIPISNYSCCDKLFRDTSL